MCDEIDRVERGGKKSCRNGKIEPGSLENHPILRGTRTKSLCAYYALEEYTFSSLFSYLKRRTSAGFCYALLLFFFVR